MKYSDIHSHALCQTDDGAQNEAQMLAMADAVYAEGTRLWCLTPHFHPGYYGDNRKQADLAYQILREYTREKYPDLVLCRGNELHYSRDCVSWLQNGLCRTMNGTRYVLVDFNSRESVGAISKGLDRLLNAGYIPILAHAERYRELNCPQIRTFRENGVLIQVNSQSPFGLFGLSARRSAVRILRERLADFVSSDAHDIKHRPPQMERCYEFIKEKIDAKYADSLCRTNAVITLSNRKQEKNSSGK